MATHSNEELVKIDGEYLSIAGFLTSLKLADQLGVLQEAIARFSLNKACDDAGISASQDEIEQHMDAFRSKRGLLSGAATESWLAARHLTDEEFVELITYEVRLGKLKDELAGPKIEEKFAYGRLDLDRIELYRIIVDDESVAKELSAQVREGASFFDLAKRHSVDEQTKRRCGYLGILMRRELKPEVESAVFNAQAGDTVGPIKSGGKFHVYLVENVYSAKLDNSTREQLREDIFREWLDKRLKDSDIDILL